MHNAHLYVMMKERCGLMEAMQVESIRSYARSQKKWFPKESTMKFKVPIEKDTLFAQELFALISEHVSDLADEHEKLPNRIIFSGALGKELHDFILEKEWNFKGFGLDRVNGIVDSVTFKYDKPFTQTENRFGTTFEGGTLHDKTINGIPGPDAAQKIISSYSQPSFSIERTVRPEKRILLSRP